MVKKNNSIINPLLIRKDLAFIDRAAGSNGIDGFYY